MKVVILSEKQLKSLRSEEKKEEKKKDDKKGKWTPRHWIGFWAFMIATSSIWAPGIILMNTLTNRFSLQLTIMVVDYVKNLPLL